MNHLVACGVDHAHPGCIVATDKDAAAIGRNAHAMGAGNNSYRGDHAIGCGVDNADRVVLVIADISLGAAGKYWRNHDGQSNRKNISQWPQDGAWGGQQGSQESLKAAVWRMDFHK